MRWAVNCTTVAPIANRLLSAVNFASVTPVEKFSVAIDAKRFGRRSLVLQSPQLQKTAIRELFCFVRTSHKNFRSGQAQKFWSVVIFASFARVAKTISSAVTCAPFESVKTKLLSADTCTSVVPVAKTFSRARHKKIGRWLLVLRSP